MNGINERQVSNWAGTISIRITQEGFVSTPWGTGGVTSTQVGVQRGQKFSGEQADRWVAGKWRAKEKNGWPRSSDTS